MCTPRVTAPRFASEWARGPRHQVDLCSGPELDETILDHRAVSASGFEGETADLPVKDLDCEVLTQKGRSGESDGHSADPSWISLGQFRGCDAGTQCHGAQPWRNGASKPLRRAASGLK